MFGRYELDMCGWVGGGGKKKEECVQLSGVCGNVAYLPNGLRLC